MHENAKGLPAGAGSGGVQKMPGQGRLDKRQPREGTKGKPISDFTMPYKRQPGERLPRKVEDMFNTKAGNKNAAMVGKARRESLLEKRKAMPKRKKQVGSMPAGPIVI